MKIYKLLNNAIPVSIIIIILLNIVVATEINSNQTSNHVSSTCQTESGWSIDQPFSCFKPINLDFISNAIGILTLIVITFYNFYKL